MSNENFRRMQRLMDDIGLMTAIIRSGRNKDRRYEVIVNGELKKKYKSRISAKRFILARFSEKLTAV